MTAMIRFAYVMAVRRAVAGWRLEAVLFGGILLAKSPANPGLESGPGTGFVGAHERTPDPARHFLFRIRQLLRPEPIPAAWASGQSRKGPRPGG